jgi:two-component system phosphate regulon sensor histidine kinase PhoR
LTNQLGLRLAAVVLLSIVPPALALIAITHYPQLSEAWPIAGCALGLFLGLAAATKIRRAINRRTENLESIARSIERGVAPAYIAPDPASLDDTAQRRLVQAASSVLTEVRSLREQRDEFEAILRSMTEAVVVTGTRGEVVMLNQAAREMFALSVDADYGKRLFVELCRDPRLQEFVAATTTVAREEIRSAELGIQNPTPRYLRISATPIKTGRGGPAAHVLVFYDLTQLKSYQSLRADFISNLTHELRTPLSALCGYAETLIRGVDDSQTQLRFLGIIERQSKRLASLIDDLLSLSDLERGLTALNFADVEPKRLLDETGELMQPAARQREIAINVCAEYELPAVLGDRDRLQQVLINLIDNAIKYTPRGGAITLSAAQSQIANGDARGAVDLIVADTGEGIPAAHIPRLTERFYRVDRARSRELGGTGLGLAIVKHIVQLHQGRLKIESRVREGTTVTVSLPVVEHPPLRAIST